MPEQVSLPVGCQTCHESAVLRAADERRIGLQQPPQLTPGPRPARACRRFHVYDKKRDINCY